MEIGELSISLEAIYEICSLKKKIFKERENSDGK